MPMSKGPVVPGEGRPRFSTKGTGAQRRTVPRVSSRRTGTPHRPTEKSKRFVIKIRRGTVMPHVVPSKLYNHPSAPYFCNIIVKFPVRYVRSPF